MTTLQDLRDKGFDESEHVPFTKLYKVRCSQCEALVLNGVPCHETGCPSQRHECKWCGSLAPAGKKFCEESCYAAYYGIDYDEEDT